MTRTAAATDRRPPRARLARACTGASSSAVEAATAKVTRNGPKTTKPRTAMAMRQATSGSTPASARPGVSPIAATLSCRGLATSAPAHRHPGHAQCRRGRRAAELQVAAHRVHVAQHLLEVAGDRHLVDGVNEPAPLDPLPGRALRVVAGDEVHAEADEVGDVEAALDRRHDLLRRCGP